MKRPLTDSFNDAIQGFIHAIRTQRNMRIHVVTAVLVLTASLILRISKFEILALILSISLVVAAELINTAVESAVDATTNYYHPLVKIAKNTAAAAVLVTAINALVIGILVFWQPLISLTFQGARILRAIHPYLALAVLGIVTLTVLFIKATGKEGTPLRGGMPSGHTAVAFSLATMLAYFSNHAVAITLAFILALIVAQSRLDTRIHSLWEIIAGAILGLALTVFIFNLIGY